MVRTVDICWRSADLVGLSSPGVSRVKANLISCFDKQDDRKTAAPKGRLSSHFRVSETLSVFGAGQAPSPFRLPCGQ